MDSCQATAHFSWDLHPLRREVALHKDMRARDWDKIGGMMPRKGARRETCAKTRVCNI